MSAGGLGSIGDDVFERITKVPTTKEFKLNEYAKEENKSLVELDHTKYEQGWCLFPGSSNLSVVAFAYSS